MSEAAIVGGGDRRERLLRAAERCFVASGFHGARMAQIAKEAQMSPGHIYHYFDSKEQIIAELVRAHTGEKQAMFERFERAGARIVDEMVECVQEGVDSNTDPFWSALMLEITAEATRNSEIAETMRAVDAEIRARVVQSLGSGVDKTDLDARLEVMVAIFQGMGIRNIVNPALDKKAVVKVMREVVEALFRTPKQTT